MRSIILKAIECALVLLSSPSDPLTKLIGMILIAEKGSQQTSARILVMAFFKSIYLLEQCIQVARELKQIGRTLGLVRKNSQSQGDCELSDIISLGNIGRIQ